jgi:hypothetical protein
MENAPGRSRLLHIISVLTIVPKDVRLKEGRVRMETRNPRVVLKEVQPGAEIRFR